MKVTLPSTGAPRSARTVTFAALPTAIAAMSDSATSAMIHTCE
jgi:hypothetical protein